jgi:hypothetical protein
MSARMISWELTFEQKAAAEILLCLLVLNAGVWRSERKVMCVLYFSHE